MRLSWIFGGPSIQSESLSEKGRDWGESPLIAKGETRLLMPQTRKCLWSSETGRLKEGSSPRNLGGSIALPAA